LSRKNPNSKPTDYFSEKNKRRRGCLGEERVRKQISSWNRFGYSAIYNRKLDGGEIDALLIINSELAIAVETKASTPRPSHISQLLKNCDLLREQVFRASTLIVPVLVYSERSHEPFLIGASGVYSVGLSQLGAFLDLSTSRQRQCRSPNKAKPPAASARPGERAPLHNHAESDLADRQSEAQHNSA